MHRCDHTLDPKPLVRRAEVITELGRRRKWSEDAKAEIMLEALAPGAVVSEVARRHDLRPQQCFGWLREARKSPEAPPTFVPVVIAPVEAPAIEELPEDKRMEIMLRLATLERVSPNTIRELDVALQGELRQQGAVSGSTLGGVELAAQVIGTMDKEVENQIMSEMEEVDAELAEQINNLRFVFEDINKIDDPGIQLIMKEIDQADLPLALKTASDELKEKLFFNMSERASDMLKDDLENLPPTKLADVEKAQKKIIEVCKKLEGEGKIQVGGAGEELV